MRFFLFTNMAKINGYTLSRKWFDFRFDNPIKCRSIHTELFMFIVDKWNRINKPNQFGLPTFSTMELLGIGSRNTYYKSLADLEEWGFIKSIQTSQNQHQSRVIAISIFEQAREQAGDQAREQASEHITKCILNDSKSYLKKRKEKTTFFDFVLIENQNLKEKFNTWQQYLNEKGKNITLMEAEQMQSYLVRKYINPDTIIMALDYAISKGWKSFGTEYMPTIEELKNYNAPARQRSIL